jgi:hypothetical protein
VSWQLSTVACKLHGIVTCDDVAGTVVELALVFEQEGVVATSSEGWWSITSGAGGPLSRVSSERGVEAKKVPPSRITVFEQRRGGGCQTKVVVPNGVYPSSLH